MGLKAGAGGVQVAVQQGEWWLRVDTPTGQRSAVVKAPRDRADSEAVAALAAALLSPGPGALPHLRALEAAGTLGEDAPALADCAP